MNPEQLHHIAMLLHRRVQSAQGTVGVYYDASGTFRVSPASGRRYHEVLTSFPGSIIGSYSPQASFDDFFEDFEDFCIKMGVRGPPRPPS